MVRVALELVAKPYGAHGRAWMPGCASVAEPLSVPVLRYRPQPGPMRRRGCMDAMRGGEGLAMDGVRRLHLELLSSSPISRL